MGNRFHPVACCIFNNVPFVSIDMYGRHPLGINIRIASKTHDLCKNIGAVRRCISLRDVNKISPRQAMELLLDWDSAQVRKYHEEAKKTFVKTIDRLLGRKDPNKCLQ